MAAYEMELREELTAGMEMIDLTERPTTPNVQQRNQNRRSVRFWCIIVALCITSLLTALESTVLITSLPTIIQDLKINNGYVWVNNLFALSSAVVTPLCGQIADLFGRRWLMIAIVAIYIVGSAICGSARNGAMLIVGRVIQGMGSGGVEMMVEVIISDLVPLRERGNFMAIILAIFALGTSLGPFLGGVIIERTTWRWIFYLNLPIGGTAMILLFLFLHVRHNHEMTLRQRLKRIDVFGGVILVMASVSVLFALTYGGSKYAWESGHILAPLLLGLSGFALYLLYEGSDLCVQPMTPVRLFQSRTSVVVFVNTFINSSLLFWVIFFLPLYFQAILGSSPSRSGVQLLPSVLMAIPGAAIAALLLSHFGKYKILHLVGFALATLGLGLFSLLGPGSSTAEWVIFQIIAAAGSGMVFDTLLPAFQAGLAESDQAAATASMAFIRCFGNVWGFAIPAAIFNTQIERRLHQIQDESVRASLSHGQAYQHATRDFVNSLAPGTQQEVRTLFTDALRLVWQIGIVFAGVAFLLVFFEKEIPLRTELETEYGLEDKNKWGEERLKTPKSERLSTPKSDMNAEDDRSVISIREM
ncbi:hypothetical protein VTN77DRAFT_5167 [Rasamsonia byssochlamydoides]|uniref:uncharacterized protein n=1 Tax=Rasamsonia byssochlamydoides TaxID=89139 RepID=UPI0037432E0C